MATPKVWQCHKNGQVASLCSHFQGREHWSSTSLVEPVLHTISRHQSLASSCAELMTLHLIHRNEKKPWWWTWPHNQLRSCSAQEIQQTALQIAKVFVSKLRFPQHCNSGAYSLQQFSQRSPIKNFKQVNLRWPQTDLVPNLRPWDDDVCNLQRNPLFHIDRCATVWPKTPWQQCLSGK